MAIVSKPQYFLGTVKGISKDDNEKLGNEREFHEIIVDIPGVIQGVKAYPRMGELDEPKVGDQVLLLSLDPEYNSYFLYEKLKESDFIGFRASGKMVDITPDYITVGVFKEDLCDYGNEEHWDGEKIKDNHITSVTIDKKGTITVEAAKENGDEGNLIVYLKGKTDITIDGGDGNKITIANDSNIDISGNSKVTISGKSDVNVTGNCTIKSSGNMKIESSGSCDINATASCTVKSPSISLKGPGTLTVNGQTLINPNGPFCGLPNCLFTGAPHASNTVLTQ